MQIQTTKYVILKNKETNFEDMKCKPNNGQLTLSLFAPRGHRQFHVPEDSRQTQCWLGGKRVASAGNPNLKFPFFLSLSLSLSFSLSLSLTRSLSIFLSPSLNMTYVHGLASRHYQSLQYVSQLTLHTNTHRRQLRAPKPLLSILRSTYIARFSIHQQLMGNLKALGTGSLVCFSFTSF